MPISPPDLQRRSFEELVDEARLRIRRYTPEYAPDWTDHNESDPGITLVQLFAWMAELTAEKVNTLPERSYLSLLELLGLEVRAATPALADIVFESIPGTARTISVPGGTRIGAPPDALGNPVVFQTTAPLDLTNCRLAYVLTFDGVAFRDVTEINADEGATIQPFGDQPQTGSSIYFGFAPPVNAERGWRPFPSVMRLRAFEPEALKSPPAVACDGAPKSAAAELVWEFLPRTGAEWSALSIYEDETSALEAGGFLMLEGPQNLEPALLWAVEDPHFWLRLRVVEPDYGSRVPSVAFFRFNTVEARHEVTVEREMIGSSDGKPDQVLALSRTPVVPGSLELEVADESGSYRLWNPVSFFRDLDPGEESDQAGPDAEVYLLDPGSGEIRFADGYRGLIPGAGSKIRARRYRFGGGEGGMKQPGEIKSLQNTLPGVKGAENPRKSVGGRNAETATEIKRTAPQWLRRRDRAVTAKDFEGIALEVGGVNRAYALAGAHPDFPQLRVPGAVSVLVVQDTDRVPPQPTTTLMRAVCDRLKTRRTLTTELYVRAPIFVKVEVTARLRVDPTRSMGVAEAAALEALDAYLAAKDPGGWRFGQPVYPAKILSELLALDESAGVRAVEGLELRVAGALYTRIDEPIELAADALVYSGRHSLTTAPDVEI